MQHDFSVWYGNASQKILAWRTLRQELLGKNLDQIIEEINDWWTFSPWVKKTLDPYNPDMWPNPWDMLNRGEFCRSAIALGQAYTLWLCAPYANTELWLVNNFSEKDIHLVVVIDEKYVLNYTLGQVLTLDKCDFEVLNKFTRDNLNHIKI
jgi:hypothetical protein